MRKCPRAEVIELFKAGKSTAEICEIVGRRATAVLRILNAWSPGAVMARRQMELREVRRAAYARDVLTFKAAAMKRTESQERQKAMAAAYATGEAVKSIAARFKVSICSVAYAAKKAGLPPRKPRGRELAQRDFAWLEMNRAGMSQLQIAEKVGRHESTVRDGVRRAIRLERRAKRFAS